MLWLPIHISLHVGFRRRQVQTYHLVVNVVIDVAISRVVSHRYHRLILVDHLWIVFLPLETFQKLLLHHFGRLGWRTRRLILLGRAAVLFVRRLARHEPHQLFLFILGLDMVRYQSHAAWLRFLLRNFEFTLRQPAFQLDFGDALLLISQRNTRDVVVNLTFNFSLLICKRLKVLHLADYKTLAGVLVDMQLPRVLVVTRYFIQRHLILF